jgi:shikimate kinase
MGAGKSSVGEALAHLLDWRFVDMDVEIQSRTGRSIPEMFAVDGESAFRAIEDELGMELLLGENLVVASGGGWAATEGRLTDLPAGTVSVWLRVSPSEAVRRAGSQGTPRPMLDSPDPLSAATELLGRREPFYSVADIALDSEGSDPQSLAVEILREIRGRARSGAD